MKRMKSIHNVCLYQTRMSFGFESGGADESGGPSGPAEGNFRWEWIKLK